MLRFITLPLLFVTLSLSAQVKYGTITYLRTTEMEWKSDNEVETPQDKEIKAMMQQMRASGAFNQEYTATFGPGEFNCVQKVKEPAEASSESGDIVIMVSIGGENPTHFYTNTEANTILNTDMILDKAFLVSGEAPTVDWTLTNEKVAPGEATAGLDLLIATGITDQNDTIRAGYAPSLPADVGPLNYHGLPGAIITLEIPRGKKTVVYRATNIQLSPSTIEIVQPTEGKEISLVKFRKEREKRNKIMERRYRN